MGKHLLLAFILWSVSVQGQKAPQILGTCSLSDLNKAPYAEWFQTGYQSYQSNTEIIRQIKNTNLSGVSLKVVFGTWCGDSKREVPRMAKIWNDVSIPESRLELIGVSDSSAFYKQSPTHEEQGLNVYRVPTFIVYQKGKEIGRINEFAVESLERDLFKILSTQDYEPNYRSFPRINQWLESGLLSDQNVNPRGLATQLRFLVSGESELNACGYVLMSRGKLNEAVTIFRMNANLFPQSANVFDSLGEAYIISGDQHRALQAYERVLQLDSQNENAKAQIAKLKK